MRIGVDIDGVLNYRQEFVIDCGTKFCAETGKGRLTDLSAHSLDKVYDWDRATRDEFWRKYEIEQMYKWPARMYAAEVIRKLKEDGHEIWIITGRNNGDLAAEGMPRPTWEETTKLWLEENGILYDEIAFDLGRPAPNDKGTFCAENQIEVMIDDLPEYLLGMVGKTQVMIFDQPYNRDLVIDGAERVYSWYDIYEKIQALTRLGGDAGGVVGSFAGGAR